MNITQLLNSAKKPFKTGENKIVLILAVLLALNTLAYLSKKTATGLFPEIPLDLNVILFVYFALTIIFMGTVLFFSKNSGWKNAAKKILIAFSFAEALFIFAIQQLVELNPLINIIVAGYVLLLLIYLVASKGNGENEAEVGFFQRTRDSFSKKRLLIAIIILSVMAINLVSGFNNLGKFAAVDEPLWLFQRIPDFWENVENMHWKNAKVSDKPGLTVALISGTGLLFENNPKQYKKEYTGVGTLRSKDVLKAEKFNLLFRTPFFLLVLLMLPLFYFILRNYVGKFTALLSFIFLGLSPILIGNSQIINPDGLLWVFSSLSLLAYLSHLNDGKRSLLSFSAIFLGLAVLTKYTANILYVFFLFLIFAEYVLNYQKYTHEPVRNYLKEKIRNYFLLIVISLSVIFVLYPAIWGTPMKLISLTVQSQPFAPIWPAFAIFLLLASVDTYILKSFIISSILKFFVKIRQFLIYFLIALFFVSVAVVFINIYGGMRFFDFIQTLASPKTSFHGKSIIEMLSTNFYPLIFGIHPVAILSLLVFLVIATGKKMLASKNYVTIIFLILFIFVYYAGSIFSGIASTIRYQISLYPLILIASGIALAGLLDMLLPRLAVLKKISFFKPENSYRYLLAPVVLAVILGATLYAVFPFNMGYTSILLPKKYFIDVKDMGEGSYEAAAFLNSLDNAKNITVWTDKKGVCTFFTGRCYTGFEKNISAIPYDYYVVSSGRDSRTDDLEAYWKYFNINFTNLYAMENTVYKLEINGRPNNYVKIIDAKNVPSYLWQAKK